MDKEGQQQNLKIRRKENYGLTRARLSTIKRGANDGGKTTGMRPNIETCEKKKPRLATLFGQDFHTHIPE